MPKSILLERMPHDLLLALRHVGGGGWPVKIGFQAECRLTTGRAGILPLYKYLRPFSAHSRSFTFPKEQNVNCREWSANACG